MKKSIKYVFVCGALLLISPCADLSAADQPATASAPMSREKSVLVTATASVEAINYKTRELTLKGPLGNTVTFTVDPQVKRLNEIKVGDLVRADYYVSLAAELRKPTAEEEKHPLTVTEAAGKAPAGTSPAAAGLRQYKVVTTIEGLDRPTETITVKGPMGRYVTVRVADPSRLTKMRIGENIVVTYTEALAISVQKVNVDKAKSE
jgi:hypothetical protein